jgi:hypothetical protein
MGWGGPGGYIPQETLGDIISGIIHKPILLIIIITLIGILCFCFWFTREK